MIGQKAVGLQKTEDDDDDDEVPKRGLSLSAS